MASVSVSQSGSASASAYGVTVDSSGSINLDGLVNKVMSTFDSKAPNFIKAVLSAAAEAGATELALEGSIAAAAALLPAEMGAVVAATGPFAPVAAIVMAIPALLLAADPASAGTGCCGTAKLTRAQAIGILQPKFPGVTYSHPPAEADVARLMRYSGQGATAAPCDPSEWSWENVWGSYPAPTSEAETFINATIRSVFDASVGCWSFMPAAVYPVALAAAIGAWNRTHAAQRAMGGKTVGPSLVTRMVNVSKPDSWGGHVVVQTGQSEDFSPISVALNMAAQRLDKKGEQTGGFLTFPNALASFNLNEGPVIKPLSLPAAVAGLRTIAMAKPSSANQKTISAAPPSKKVVLSVSPAGLRKVAAVVPWQDKHLPVVGASPKELGVTAAIVGALAWGAKRLRG